MLALCGGVRRCVHSVRRKGPAIPENNTQKGEPTEIEHLVIWQEDGGRVIVLGLDAECRPVYTTTLFAYL
jgi:hypothetical protein